MRRLKSLVLVLILVIAIPAQPASAAEIVRLKNGATIRTNRRLVMKSLSGQPYPVSELNRNRDATPDPPSIAYLENDWQVFYVSLNQLLPADANGNAGFAGAEPIKFPISKARSHKSSNQLRSLGSMLSVSEFDEYGRRRVNIATQGKPQGRDLVQSITEIGPDHFLVDSAEIAWKFGLSLKTLPFETLDKIIRKQVPPDNEKARFALARFYIEAEYYEQAFAELDAIGRDFPDKMSTVDERRVAFMDYFGIDILQRLKQRKRTGQHALAEFLAKQLIKQPLSITVKQGVQKYLQDYEDARQKIERVKLLLGDWQAKLNDTEQVMRLEALRSEINEQLDFETLPRLDAFLKAEDDTQYEPAQRLGLAYSGWLLGPANAIPDLDHAFRISDARSLILEYLRTDDPGRQSQLMRQLQAAENISADKAVLQMIDQLPPILEASDIDPGVPHQVVTPGAEPARYWVTLPPEYSPHHNYPMVIALRSRNCSAEETLYYWSGDVHRPDLGAQRGYIVIVPEYAERGQVEYSFGAPAHKCVLDCLIDARKRFSVDSDRVYLTGHGMGADAAFDIGMAHPDEFAGVVPFGGHATNYCTYLWKNARYTAWYVVGTGSYSGTRETTSNQVFDKIMRPSKFDFTLVEYIGRNGEVIYDEISKAYDWMELSSHVRPTMPKEFEIRSLRKTDDRFFWITANALPHNNILPNSNEKVTPMDISARVSPGNTTTNIITLPGLTESYSIRLTPELVDFGKKVTVKIGSRQKFNDFVKPDTRALLEELQLRGDRKRLPLAVISP